MKVEVYLYESSLKDLWDDFIRGAINSHFMHYRDFMDYHSERFQDHSLIFKDEREHMVAVLPANISEKKLYSHQGLTFGGVLVSSKLTAISLIAVFEALIDYCRKNNFEKVVYKRSPDFYYDVFFQDDLYALFLEGSRLTRRDLNSTVDLKSSYKYSKGRKWSINKARKEGLDFFVSEDYGVFWGILGNVLEKHNAKPTHTVDEISMLASRFPKNIKLYLAKKKDEILAGVVVFINKNVVNTQYMASTEKGREVGALDFLVHQLMIDEFKDKSYFNFGISTEDSGKILNEGLLLQKNGFGARSTVHEFYEIDIK